MISQESRVSLNSDRARSGGKPIADAGVSQEHLLSRTKLLNANTNFLGEVPPRHHVYREQAAEGFGGVYGEQIKASKEEQPSVNLESCSSLSLSHSNIIVRFPADLDEAR